MNLDEAIRDALAAEPVATSSIEDRAAIDRAAGRYRRRRFGARIATGVGVVALVVLAVVVWPRPSADVSLQTADEGAIGAPVPKPDGIPADWVLITDPTLGWTMWTPPSWIARSFEDQCRILESGTIVRSNGAPPAHDESPTSCSTQYDWRGVSRTSVLVAVTYRPPRFGGGLIGSTVPVVDTPFPLAVGEVGAPVSTPTGSVIAAERSASYLLRWGQGVIVGGDDGYRVEVWYGIESSEQDRADARLVVASMRPPAQAAPDDHEVPPDPTVPGPTGGAPGDGADIGARTVLLPSMRRRGADEAWMGALATGTVVREGDCLYLDTPYERYTLVFNGEASMLVTDEEVLKVTLEGERVPFEPGPVEVGGGEVAWGALAVSNLREECRTGKMWVM